MFAVIKTGGKQYRVTENQIVKIEKLPAGEENIVELSDVMMIINGDQYQVGKPYLTGAKVIAEIVEEGKSKKVTTIKFRRRQGYMRKKGHRQLYTKVKIKGIYAAGADVQ